MREERIVIAGRELLIARPDDPESLIDEERFEEDEFLPYWAELWPSGVALARYVASLDLTGTSVLELGCGLALPSFAAAWAGAEVLATDWAPEAVELAAQNASANGLDITTAVLAWEDGLTRVRAVRARLGRGRPLRDAQCASASRRARGGRRSHR